MSDKPAQQNIRLSKLHTMVSRLVAGIPIIVQSIYRLNKWIASFLHLPDWASKQLLKAEIFVLLGIGSQMIQLEEYAFAIACWVAVCLIWISKAVSWGGFP